MLTPAGSSGAGAGWTPGRESDIMAHGPQAGHLRPHGADAGLRPETARAKAEAQGYGRGAARAFAGPEPAEQPRRRPPRRRRGVRGAVREPVEYNDCSDRRGRGPRGGRRPTKLTN